MRYLIPMGLAAIVVGGGAVIFWSVRNYGPGGCSKQTTVVAEGSCRPVSMNAPDRSEILVKHQDSEVAATARAEPAFAPVSAFGGSNCRRQADADQKDKRDPRLVEAIMKAMDLEKLQMPETATAADEGPAEVVVNALEANKATTGSVALPTLWMPRCEEDVRPARMPYADEGPTGPPTLTPNQLPTPLPAGGKIRMPTAEEPGQPPQDKPAHNRTSLWEFFSSFDQPALEPAFHYFVF